MSEAIQVQTPAPSGPPDHVISATRPRNPMSIDQITLRLSLITPRIAAARLALESSRPQFPSA